jgi:DNA (cytosine-5)-methyltransferase 1
MPLCGISLFSGAGGLDIGAENAGIKITDCIEIDHDSAETLRINSINIQKTIHEIDIQNIDFKMFDTGVDRIIFGGPPCQPFSKNGYWVKNENRLIETDPRNLLDQFIRSVSELKPLGFLFENVESILHPTNIKTLDRFIEMANNIGYSTIIYRSNALNFGIPQRRKRVFVFGIRGLNKSIPSPTQTHGELVEANLFSKQLLPITGVIDFIQKYDDKKFYEKNEDASLGTYYHELCAVTPGRNYMSLTNLENYKGRKFVHGKRFWNFLYKLHPNEPSITIAAQPGPWVGPFHWDNRRLRVPELAAIQTFPETYKFFGNRRSIQKQIGNAVPCLLGQRMMEHLLRLI